MSCGWKRLQLLKELQELTNVKKLFGQVSDQIPQESDEMTVEELNCDLDMSGRFINFRSYEDALDALELTTGLMVQAVSLPGPEPEDPYKGVNWHRNSVEGGQEMKLNIERLDQSRILAGLTKRELAKKVGVSEASIYRLFGGHTQSPRLVLNVCRTLEISTAQVYQKEYK